ncbi:MAG: carbon-nitrogen family hydrolase [Clostridia bacterium]|nr:carbon-nitrogen family hydrolase [Clostridia bacterium]
MKVALIQMDVAFGEPERNFEKAELLLARAAEHQPDAIVLPELWNTGFFPRENLFALADPIAAQTKVLCSMFANEHQVNIVAGSVAERRGKELYNACYIFDRTGFIPASYEKLHLFSTMEENLSFTPGKHLGWFQLDGVNCGAEICYDLRFPEQARAMALKGMDVMFVAAQWPVQRIETLHTLAKARAIENLCFVCVCNACGQAPGTDFGGGSCVFSPLGETLAIADDTEQIVTAVLDLSVLPDIRSKINVFRDRRTDIFN